ncbi:hypothetical protein M378DRAFT_77391 [Amanita muscaria Koide BX008]|uniref:RING-type domain-containing protein n=1 Tax=Amanita muscaria (strain Koide BX008) TaxID=946122 RepID=A0A0C2SP95_AMAMK|nr:hypothetical protein M378DRAFT_77391 [Amanita muscaria Koide BX008]
MLTLGANSTCDVCLEHFGTDHKAPYSIHCGHVFCFDCIRRVSPPECPLCRTPYLPGKWLKLHVDLSALPLTGTEKEARRLQEAIGEVTTLGSSEANSRQLINECRVFLQAQPRSTYADLRVAYRMLSYLCEVKTSLRTQNATNLQHLKDEVAQLEDDKSELQRRLAASEASRDKDKQFATDLESRLNTYVTRAESSYQTLSYVVISLVMWIKAEHFSSAK